MDCIDSNPNNESQCDDLIQILNQCLQQNKEYYDKINVSELQKKEEESKHKELHSAWEEFLGDLEAMGEESVVFQSFSKGMEPEMQVRLESKVGAVSFHPSLKQDGVTKTLIMGYVKDENNKLLGSGSVEDLFYYEVGEVGMYALRFGIEDDSKEVTAFALYEDENGNGKHRKEEIIIFSHKERLPNK